MKHIPVAALVIVVGALLFGIALALNWSFVHDDTFITLRYVRNVLAGHGPVWNPEERVEGYTSFLHLLLLSAGGAAGVELLASARWLNFLSVILAAVYVAYFAWTRYRREPRASAIIVAVPPMLVLGTFPMAIWTRGGLEAPIFALAVALGVGSAIHFVEQPSSRIRAAVAGLALGLPILTRPDGALFLIVSGSFCLWTLFAKGRRHLASLQILGLCAVALPLAHSAWRFGYYGSWIPNTVFTKVLGVPAEFPINGFRYAWHFITSPPYPAIFGLVAACYAYVKREARVAVTILMVNSSAYGLLIIQANGDHMPAHRLLVPLIPLCAMMTAYGLAPILRRRDVLAAVGGVGILAMCLLLQFRGPTYNKNPAAFMGTIIANHIMLKWPEGTLIASNCAGSIPYFADRYIYVDMLGLNDAHIGRRRIERLRLRWQRVPGHAKGDGRYVFRRRPEIIILGPPEGTYATEPWFLSDLELVEMDAFSREYVMRKDLIDVRGSPDYEEYGATRGGWLRFIYYERSALASNGRANDS